jgi:hypothetical protein
MHRADGEAALQHRIGIGMTQRNPARRDGVGMAFNALDAAAQGSKHVGACAGHAPVPSEISAGFRQPEAGSFVHDMF